MLSINYREIAKKLLIRSFNGSVKREEIFGNGKISYISIDRQDYILITIPSGIFVFDKLYFGQIRPKRHENKMISGRLFFEQIGLDNFELISDSKLSNADTVLYCYKYYSNLFSVSYFNSTKVRLVLSHSD